MFIKMIRLEEYYFSFDTRLYTEDTLIIYRPGKVEFSRYREDRTTDNLEWKIGMDVISLLSRLAHAGNFSRYRKSYIPPYCGTSSNHILHLGICMEDGTKKTTSLVGLTKQIVELSEMHERLREAGVR